MTVKRFSLKAAVYLILTKDNKVLFMRRFNTGWRDGQYTLPAGHLDGSETITQAMSREAQEETGIVISPEELRVIHVVHQNMDAEYIDFYLVADKWEGEPMIKETDKCDDIQWYALDALPDNVLPNVKAALINYQNGLIFSEFK